MTSIATRKSEGESLWLALATLFGIDPTFVRLFQSTPETSSDAKIFPFRAFFLALLEIVGYPFKNTTSIERKWQIGNLAILGVQTMASARILQIAAQLASESTLPLDRLPYTDEFEALYEQFVSLAGPSYSRHECWWSCIDARKRGMTAPRVRRARTNIRMTT